MSGPRYVRGLDAGYTPTPMRTAMLALIVLALYTIPAAQTPAGDRATRTGSLRQIIPGHYV